MTKLKLLAFGVLAATAVSTVQAESQWVVSAGVDVINSPYKQYDRDIYPVPVVTYEDDNVRFHDLGGGYYLRNDMVDKLSIMAYHDPTHFKSGDSGSHALRQLDKRKSSLMAGLSYVHNIQYDFLHTALVGDTLDNNSGFIWDLAWPYRYTNDGLILTPDIGVQCSSENYNDYYYGASNHESRRSGLKGYNADDGRDPYPELTVSYDFIGNWNVYGIGHYVCLNDEVKNSLMVDKFWSGTFLVGVIYKF